MYARHSKMPNRIPFMVLKRMTDEWNTSLIDKQQQGQMSILETVRYKSMYHMKVFKEYLEKKIKQAVWFDGKTDTIIQLRRVLRMQPDPEVYLLTLRHRTNPILVPEDTLIAEAEVLPDAVETAVPQSINLNLPAAIEPPVFQSADLNLASSGNEIQGMDSNLDNQENENRLETNEQHAQQRIVAVPSGIRPDFQRIIDANPEIVLLHRSQTTSVCPACYKVKALKGENGWAFVDGHQRSHCPAVNRSTNSAERRIWKTFKTFLNKNPNKFT